jgi:hypothetical protein
MITKINELYQEAVSAGKKVTEIAISYIAYDHLKSELNNRKAEPKWLSKVKVKEGVSGVQLIDDLGII